MAASRRVHLAALLAVGAVGALAGLDWAQNQVNVEFHSFQDTRGVTVLTPTIDVSKDFTDRTALRLRFGVDAITAASDSCARCHPGGANNGRVALNGGLIRKYGDTKWTIGGELSKENFYTAVTGLTSLSRDLNQGDTTVAAGFSFSVNRPVLHPTFQAEQQLDTDVYGLVTQTLTRTTIAQVGYELNRINGYQTNPFLRVLVNGNLTLGNEPSVRTRHAITARVKQALPGGTFLEADYRRYLDSWSIDSNSLSVGLTHQFSPRILIGGTYRWYDQTGAYFYQPSYTGSPTYYTSDFRLIPFTSGQYSGRLVFTPKDRVWNLPKGSQFTVEYRALPLDDRLPGRRRHGRLAHPVLARWQQGAGGSPSRSPPPSRPARSSRAAPSRTRSQATRRASSAT